VQSEDGGGTDLASLVQNLQTNGDGASVAPKFEKNDKVVVVEGEAVALLAHGVS
jgi:hypothetical protein